MENQKPRQIVVGQPTVTRANGKARMMSVVSFEGRDTPVWVEVDEAYGDYLCSERSDAYAVGLLNFAMREGCDIVCKAPMGLQLKYQLETYLVPTLARHDLSLYKTRILADEDAADLPCADGVGAGCSCGIDSLHVIKRYGGEGYRGIRLTHLTLFKIGGISYNESSWQAKLAQVRAFCREYGHELVVIDTNFSTAFRQDHLFTDGYANSFGVLALQKLWKTYFYGSSGMDLSCFELADNSKRSDAHYDLLLFDCLSTGRLRFYLDGLDVPRFEKLKYILDFEPTRKYLDVCLENTGRNCGRCHKCERTLVMLDSLGVLDEFTATFDISKYRAKRHRHLRWLYRQQVIRGGDPSVVYSYRLLKHEITFRMRLPVYVDQVRQFFGWRGEDIGL